MEIIMTKTNYIKPIKNWQKRKTETEQITKKQYDNIISIDTLKFFRNLGGTERTEKTYTCRGYNVTKLISICPSKPSSKLRSGKIEFVATTVLVGSWTTRALWISCVDEL